MKRCAVCWRWGESGEGKPNDGTVQSLPLCRLTMPLPGHRGIDIVEVSLSSFDELLCGTGVLQ